MFRRQSKLAIQTARLTLRLPHASDYAQWLALRTKSDSFLAPWEPLRAADYQSRRAFLNRVYWAERSYKARTSVPVLVVRREDNRIVAGLTLDNIRQGAAMAASVGYWVGSDYVRQGYMRESLDAVVNYGFNQLDLSRIEAACLPENKPSRALLEQSGFKYEGVAQSYLQIAGRWRKHVLYTQQSSERRGKTEAG